MIVLPFLFLFCILVTTITLFFTGVPFVLFTLLTLMLYYCCTKDALPFPVLLRALLFLEDIGGETNGNNRYPNAEDEPVKTQKEIRTLLIRRQLLTCKRNDESCTNIIPSDDAMMGTNLLADHTVQSPVWFMEPCSGTVYLFSAPLANLVCKSEDCSDGTTCSVTPVASRDGETDIESSPVVSNQSTSDTSPSAINNDDLAAPVLVLSETETGVSRVASEERIDDDYNSGTENDATVDAAAIGTEPDTPEAHTAHQEQCDDFSDHDQEGTACNICFLAYEAGDVLAWSRNPHCSHSYHEDCVADWLQRKPTCPSCRRDYFVTTPTEEQGSDDNV
jgi:hypothetical protein